MAQKNILGTLILGMRFTKRGNFAPFSFAQIWYTGRMIITYLGKQFFKVQQGDLVIAFNPISKDSDYGAKVSRFGAQVALTTTNHPDYNGIDTVTYGEAVPFTISGPGDYEVKDISVKGAMTWSEIGGKKYVNTSYSLIFEGLKLSFLGALSSPDISAEAREAVDSADILFVPIGGKGLLEASLAYKLAVSLEPKIIIPMDYDDASLKIFLKEGGDDKIQPIDKLTLKKKDLEGKEGDIIVLSN